MSFDVCNNLHQLTPDTLIDNLAVFEGFNVAAKVVHAPLDLNADISVVASHRTAFRNATERGPEAPRSPAQMATEYTL